MEINRPRTRVRMGQPSHSDNDNLHQNIHSHETIRQASDALVAQDVEITALREQLRSFHSLEAETEEVLEDLETVCQRAHDLERRTQQHQDQTEVSLRHQLRDALERNQQWQAYERQREAHVKRLLARLSWLEERLNQANEGLSRHKEAHSDEMRRTVQEMQEHYDKLLHNTNMHRDELREQVSTAQQNMNDMQRRCEATQREVEELEQQVEAERLQHRENIQEERRRWALKEDTLKFEAQEERRRWALKEDALRAEAQEERRRWALKEDALRAEAQELHSSLELEARRAAELHLQVEMSSKTLEDERRECLLLQEQLHKVLKNLHKTRRHVTQRSQTERQGAAAGADEARLHSNRPKPSKQQRALSSPPRTPDLLDETLLECPGCQALYPTSRHRELLAHLDRCLD